MSEIHVYNGSPTTHVAIQVEVLNFKAENQKSKLKTALFQDSLFVEYLSLLPFFLSERLISALEQNSDFNNS